MGGGLGQVQGCTPTTFARISIHIPMRSPFHRDLVLAVSIAKRLYRAVEGETSITDYLFRELLCVFNESTTCAQIHLTV